MEKHTEKTAFCFLAGSGFFHGVKSYGRGKSAQEKNRRYRQSGMCRKPAENHKKRIKMDWDFWGVF